MPTPLFDVHLANEIMPGCRRDRVVRKLARCLACDPATADRRLARGAVIAQGLPLDEARQYLAVLEMIGAMGHASTRPHGPELVAAI